MLGYIIRRMFMSLPVIFIVITIIFFVVDMMPGDAIDVLITPDQGVSAAEMTQMRANKGLDDPGYVKYFKWLSNVVQGDFGRSLISNVPVMDRITERIGPTFLLMGTGILLGICLAIPVGIFSALRQYSIYDYTVTILAFIVISIPAFFIGLSFIYLFSLKLNLFPVGGIQPILGQVSFLNKLHHLFLPAIVVALPYISRYGRYTRSTMLEVIKEQYIQTARAKGLSERTVIIKHALRNALIPIITLLGMSFPWMLSGSVVIEKVFNWPGIGMLTIEALMSRDYPILIALNIIFALLVVIGNLLSDILYSFVDPRIRVGGEAR